MTDPKPEDDPRERVVTPLDPAIERRGPVPVNPQDDPVDEMERESFPASDPHSGWAGPPDS
jgi:hypothetical protein